MLLRPTFFVNATKAHFFFYVTTVEQRIVLSGLANSFAYVHMAWWGSPLPCIPPQTIGALDGVPESAIEFSKKYFFHTLSLFMKPYAWDDPRIRLQHV